MLGAQLVERSITTHLEIEMKYDARSLQAIDPAHHHILFQLETGDAVSEQAACAIIAIVDVNLITGDTQLLGRGQSTRACADDADRLAAGRACFDWFDPAFGPGGIGDVFFDAANGNRAMARKLDNAIAFAQPILRADATADFGHAAGQV